MKYIQGSVCMKEIRNNIEKLKEEISTIDKSEYKSVFNNISSILDGLSNKIDEIMVNEAVLSENLKYMDDDISEIQEELFEEVSLEDLDEFESEYTEVSCSKCAKPIFIEASALEEDNIPCPYCGENIVK